RAADGQVPLSPEIAFFACLGICRDDRQEQSTALDLFADRRIPGLPTPQFALVEPDLESCLPQGSANALCSLGILRCVADEECLDGCALISHKSPEERS